MMKSLATKAMLAAGVATVAMSAVSAPAEAFQVFTDRTAWQSAITGANPTVTETFDTSPLGISVVSSSYLTPSGITIGAEKVGGISPESVGNLSNRVFASVIDSQSASLVLPSPSVAFGVDLIQLSDFSGADNLNWSASLASGSPQTGAFVASFSPRFLGFVASNPNELISSVQFTSGGFLSSVNFDNATFATPKAATPIPTPALLPGLVGMGIAAYRKRKLASSTSA